MLAFIYFYYFNVNSLCFMLHCLAFICFTFSSCAVHAFSPVVRAVKWPLAICVLVMLVAGRIFASFMVANLREARKLHKWKTMNIICSLYQCNWEVYFSCCFSVSFLTLRIERKKREERTVQAALLICCREWSEISQRQRPFSVWARCYVNFKTKN